DAPVFTRSQASLNDLRSVLPLVLEARREVLATGGRGGTVSMAYSASGTGEAGRSSRAEGRGSSRGRSRSRRAACRRARSPTIRVSSRPQQSSLSASLRSSRWLSSAASPPSRCASPRSNSRMRWQHSSARAAWSRSNDSPDRSLCDRRLRARLRSSSPSAIRRMPLSRAMGPAPDALPLTGPNDMRRRAADPRPAVITWTTARLAGGVGSGRPNRQPEAATAISARSAAAAWTKTKSSPRGDSRAATGLSRYRATSSARPIAPPIRAARNISMVMNLPLRAAGGQPAERRLLGPAAARQQRRGALGTLPGRQLGPLDLQEDQQPFRGARGESVMGAHRLFTCVEKGQEPSGGPAGSGGSNS